MKISKKTWLVIAGSFLILGGGVAALELTNTTNFLGNSDQPSQATDTNPSASTNLNPPSEEELSQAERDKLNRIENGQSQAQTETRVIIRSVSQNSQTKDVVVITELYGQSWSSCELTLSKGSENLTKTAGTVYQSSYSSCQGFSIPSSQFPSSGTWDVTLKGIKSDGSSNYSEHREVIVEK